VVVQCTTRATNGVVAIALHPDGHTVAVARGIPGRTGNAGVDVQTVDLQTGVRQVMYTDAYRHSLIHTVAFEPDGSHLTFTVRDTTTMAEVSYTVALCTLLAGVPHRVPVIVHDVVTGQPLEPHPHPVRVQASRLQSCWAAGRPPRP
jgi:hypothetical protein